MENILLKKTLFYSLSLNIILGGFFIKYGEANEGKSTNGETVTHGFYDGASSVEIAAWGSIEDTENVDSILRASGLANNSSAIWKQMVNNQKMTVNFNILSIDNPKLYDTISLVLKKKGWFPSSMSLEQQNAVANAAAKSIKNTFYVLVREQTGIKFNAEGFRGSDYGGIATASKPLTKTQEAYFNSQNLKNLYSQAIEKILRSKNYGDSDQVSWYMNPKLIKMYPILKERDGLENRKSTAPKRKKINSPQEKDFFSPKKSTVLGGISSSSKTKLSVNQSQKRKTDSSSQKRQEDDKLERRSVVENHYGR